MSVQPVASQIRTSLRTGIIAVATAPPPSPARAARPPDPARWNEAAAIAAAALSGQVTREVGAATHYHAAYVSPAWRTKLTLVRRIGLHLFYSTARGGAGPGMIPVAIAKADPAPSPKSAVVYTPWGLRIATNPPAATDSE